MSTDTTTPTWAPIWEPVESWTPQAPPAPVKQVWSIASKNGREIGLTDDPEYVDQMVGAGYFATPV